MTVSEELGAGGFSEGGGELGALVREVDWSKTPLGARSTRRPVRPWDRSCPRFPATPPDLVVPADHEPSIFRDVLEDAPPREVRGLAPLLAEQAPGPWPEPPDRAWVLPLLSGGGQSPTASSSWALEELDRAKTSFFSNVSHE